MTPCEELNQIIYENYTMDERNKLMLAMESDKGKFDALKGFFDGVLDSVRNTANALIGNTELNKALYNSKGDITKVKEFDITLKTLSTLSLAKDKRILEGVSQCRALYSAIVGEKTNFQKASTLLKDGKLAGTFVYVVYVTHVKLLVTATSQLVSLYLGQQNHPGYCLKFALPKTIQSYNDGSVAKYINFFLNDKSKYVKEDAGATLAVSAIVIAAVIAFGFFLRVLVFYFYYSRTLLSDYFEHQSHYLNLHASEVKKNNNFDKEKKDSILQAQKKWADRFMELSELIAVDDIQSARQAEKAVKQSNKDINPTKIKVPNTGMDFF